MSKICQYCGSEAKDSEPRCNGCDAASFGEQPVQRYCKGEPFHYNGYVVWWVEDIMRMTVEWLFYLGDRLVERIVLSRYVLEEFIPEHCDGMLFIWDLFKLAQGEEKVLRITKQNAARPAVFKITVEPSPELKWAAGLTHGDVYAAIAAGEREITYRA